VVFRNARRRFSSLLEVKPVEVQKLFRKEDGNHLRYHLSSTHYMPPE
jgi:hypothetical protein